MEIPRRRFLHLGICGAALLAVSQDAHAQAYPSRAITIIVPFPAGGNTDANARVLAEQIRGLLGQPVIIENVSGADGSIGTGRVARARPDGYTIEMGSTSTNMMNGAIYSLPYDLVNDFVPISLLFTSPYVLVARKTMPVKDMNELIAWENQSQQGVGGNWCELSSPNHRILSKTNRDAIHPRTVSWHCPRNARPRGRPDRPASHQPGRAVAATGAGRNHKGLCRGK